MAQTLAFLFLKESHESCSTFERLAASAGYAVTWGLHNGDPEVTDGIQAFANFQSDLLEIGYLSSEPGSTDAFSIHEDIMFGAMKSPTPHFFDFLKSLEIIAGRGLIYMIACTEWLANEEAVWVEGRAADLVNYLKTVNTFGLLLWSPTTGRIQDSDRYPLVFSFRANLTK